VLKLLLILGFFKVLRRAKGTSRPPASIVLTPFVSFRSGVPNKTPFILGIRSLMLLVGDRDVDGVALPLFVIFVLRVR